MFYYVCVYIYTHTQHLLYPVVAADGHLGCFHALAILNGATWNIGMHVSFWISVFIFFSRYICRSGMDLTFFAANVYWSNQWPSLMELGSFWKWEELHHCWWALGPPWWRFRGPWMTFHECLWKRHLPAPAFFPGLSGPRHPHGSSHLPPSLRTFMWVNTCPSSVSKGRHQGCYWGLSIPQNVCIWNRIAGKCLIRTQWNASQGEGHFRQPDHLALSPWILPG